MPFLYADRVRETSTSTGTGTFALAGAVSNFRTFASAIGASNTTYYAIVHRTAAEWEVGYGTLDALGTTLTRTTVLYSSTGSAVSFTAGTKDVFVTIPSVALSSISTPNSTGSALQALTLSPFGTSAGNTAEIRFLELAANGTNYVGLKASDSLAGNQIWTLPTADGTSGQFLQTNGSGVTTWATVTSVGTVTTGTWNATPITPTYGGTGLTSIGNSNSLLGTNNLTTGLEWKTLVPGGNISIVHGPNTITLTPTATVTSVGLSLPSIFTVSNSPVTSSGTLTGTLATQSANLVFSGPTTGVAATPTFRSLVAADLPTITSLGTVTTGTWNASIIGLAYGGTNANLTAVNGGVAYSTASALALTAAGTANQVLVSNGAAAPTWASGLTLNAQQALLLNPYGASAGNTSELRFAELAANGSHYVAFKSADSVASSLTWTLPNADGGKGQYLQTNGSGTLSWNGGPYPCQGRLTLASGTPVAINVTGSVLYFTPYLGNLLALYNTTRNVWENHTLTEISFTPAGGWAANTNYDIFIYNLSGTLTLTAAIWTNNTTRATGITKQDGVLVMSGQVSYRYIGTVRCTNTANTLADTDGFRLVWNYYNRIMRGLFASDNAQWTYGGAGSTTQRFSNNNYANRVDIVCGETQGGVFYLSVDSQRNAAGTTFVALGQQSATIPTGTPATQMGTILYPASFGANANTLSLQTNHSRSLFQDFNAAYYAIHGVEWNNVTTVTSTFIRYTILGCWAC